MSKRKAVRVTNWRFVDDSGEFTTPAEGVFVKGDIDHPSSHYREAAAVGIVTAPVIEIRKRKTYTVGGGLLALGKINVEYRQWLRDNCPGWSFRQPFIEPATVNVLPETEGETEGEFLEEFEKELEDIGEKFRTKNTPN